MSVRNRIASTAAALALTVFLFGCGDTPKLNQIVWDGVPHEVTSVSIQFEDVSGTDEYNYQFNITLDTGEEFAFEVWDKSVFQAGGTYSSTLGTVIASEDENAVDWISTNIPDPLGPWENYASEEIGGSMTIDIGDYSDYTELEAMNEMERPVEIDGTFTLDDGGDGIPVQFHYSGNASFEIA